MAQSAHVPSELKGSVKKVCEPVGTHLVITPLVPVIVLVLAFTAVPVELRTFDSASLSWNRNVLDLLANIVGYVPVGMVLAKLRCRRAIFVAAILTCAAELFQFLMMYRFPSLFDVAMNMLGTVVGLLLTRY